MGQTIEITNTVLLDEVALIDTDRSLTGQDGEAYASAAEAGAGSTLPAGLATRLFATDDRIEHVYVFSNTLSVRRAGGWDDGAVETAAAVIRAFFVYYGEDENAGDD